MANPKVSMKLLIDRRGKRVVFTEAGKECVDFLFELLSLPVATIIGLVGAEGMEGSLPNLHQSLKDLNKAYILPKKDKKTLLNPLPSRPVPLLSIQDSSTDKPTYNSQCRNCNRIADYNYRPDCAYCGRKMGPEDGLVKGVVKYMVMDDLEVKPMSTISTVTLLKKYEVKDASDLEEKMVYLGMNEAVDLLEASLRSDNVLTDLFC